MTADPPSPDRIAEVSRLCTLLADRALDALIMGRPVPPEQIAALVKAGGVLRDHGLEWPPLLEQVLHNLAQEADDTDAGSEVTALAPAPDTLPDVDLHGLTRFFSGLRKAEGQP